MSYTVLARKWRPRGFAEMVGQEHVIRALVNALDGDRLHHAFLFAGTRGVGKTTIARVLAKCLNCDAGVTSKPCDNCAACNEIDEGRFVDLIEVDAASRTKVDDTRELLDNVQYSPTRGRYKVYLIDEVHMLSRHSFNALLKTLEEPPPHVKFLLATTDPHKLPVTVLSRCLQFNLKRLTLDLIGAQLEKICTAEKFDHDAEAITLLARAADGSMRDGLSLLDQAIAFGGGGLKADDVRLMLGTVDRRQVLRVLDALIAGDAAGLFEVVAKMHELSPDYEAALADIAAILQRAALVQVVPDAIGENMDDADAIRSLAATMPAEDIQVNYQIALLGRRDLRLAPDQRSGFEMTLLRMLAFAPAGDGGRDTAATPVTQAQRPAPTSGMSAATTAKKTAPPTPAPAAGKATPAQTPAPAPTIGVADWQTTLAQLPLQGAARQLAANCVLTGIDGRRVRLQLAEEHAHLLTDQQRKRLTKAFSDHLKQDVDLHVEITTLAEETLAERDQRHDDARSRAALESLENDPNVRALKDAFGAVVENQSVKPLSK